MAISFDLLKNSYPHEDKADLYNMLGGEWPDLINDANYQNTCAIRMSVAFRRAGMPIPTQYREAVDGENNSIILKVKTMDTFVRENFGDFTWGMSKPEGTDITADIPTYKGIIVYHASFDDATGHFDLWEVNDFVGVGEISDIKDGYDIAIWKLD